MELYIILFYIILYFHGQRLKLYAHVPIAISSSLVAALCSGELSELFTLLQSLAPEKLQR